VAEPKEGEVVEELPTVLPKVTVRLLCDILKFGLIV
jgi:hypothetical protein